MKNIRTTGFWVLALFLVAFLTELNYARYFHMAGDSAGYVDLIRQTSEHGDMRSRVFAAAYPLFDLSKTAAVFCVDTLVNKYENNSFFQWHSYGIVFPIAWVGTVFTHDYMYIAAVVNALSVTLIYGAVILICRKIKFNYIEILLVLGVLLTFAPLIGAISGQYYFDRLFIPVSLFYFYQHLHRTRDLSWIPSVALILLGALISERSALMIGVIAIYLAVFDCKENLRYRIIAICSGMAAILYYVIWSKLFQDSIYSGATSPGQMIANLKAVLDPDSQPFKQTVELLTFLAPLILLALARPKYLLLFAILLAPNILLSVGGAEKTGFMTHYHSYYIPVLLIAALMGYRRWTEWLTSRFAGYILLAIVIAANVVKIRGKLFVVSPILSHSIGSDMKILQKNSSLRSISNQRLAVFSGMIANIKERDPTISTNEFLMPFLVSRGFSKIRLFPIGINESEYLITESPVAEDKENLILPIYGDASELKAISSCMSEKVESQYTEISTGNVGSVRYRLMKRAG
jgi:hypothetical protein